MCDTCGCPSPSDHNHEHEHNHDYGHDHHHSHGQSKKVAVHTSLFAANDALAKATTEAILFSGTDPAAVELMFMSPRQISAEGIRDIADRIEISAPPEAAPEPAPEPAAAPGSDPAKPPRLR